MSLLSTHTKIHDDSWKTTTNRNPLVTEMPQKQAFTQIEVTTA